MVAEWLKFTIPHKFICDEAKCEKMQVKDVKSEDQLADMLTKPMSKMMITKLRKLTGLK